MHDRTQPPNYSELRRMLANAIADAKAYDVPPLCQRLGLAEGTGDEAHSSKFQYAKKRLELLDSLSVLKAAKAYLGEESNFELSECVAKIEEASAPIVSSLTRRRILSLFDTSPLATELSELDILSSLWPLDRMVLKGSYPEETLSTYLWQHTIRNNDLTQKEVFDLIGVMTCSQAQFFRFLNAVMSPEAQTPFNQEALAAAINELLKKDGFALKIIRKISGSPIYEVAPAPLGSPADSDIAVTLATFESDRIHDRWTAALDRRSDDPEGAITLARTLLEDVCKWILDEAGETWKEADDLPVLYKKLAKTLQLAPDDYTEQLFKQILGSCQSIVESLGALRNKLGDAHSVGPKRARPLPRHAEMAVNLAGTMATFLVSTWKARQAKSDASS